MRIAVIYTVVVAIGVLHACTEPKQQTVESNSKQARHAESDASADRVRETVDVENDRIEGYIERRGLEMTRTESGLRYQVIKEGEGEPGKEGQEATVAYSIALLDGTPCYERRVEDPVTFRIGFDHVESGIHEVVSYLKPGAEAKVILPNHLAFGLTGDNDKIPPLAAVVYDLKIVSYK